MAELKEHVVRTISEWLASNGLAGADFVAADRQWTRAAAKSWYRPPASPVGDGLQFQGADHPGHALVTAGRVGGVPVYDRMGEPVGRVFDVSIEKGTGQVVHVLLGRGGIFGFGRRYHPLPWAIFGYAPDRRGYVLPFTAAQIARTPSLRRDELEWCGAGYRSPFDDTYANAYLDLPIA